MAVSWAVAVGLATGLDREHWGKGAGLRQTAKALGGLKQGLHAHWQERRDRKVGGVPKRRPHTCSRGARGPAMPRRRPRHR